MSIAFQHLNVYAFGRQTDYQRTVSNFLNAWTGILFDLMAGKSKHRVDILQEFNGLVSSGEMLLVLGNPGSGCTTLLKSLSGQTYDLCIDTQSLLNYQGKCTP